MINFKPVEKHKFWKDVTEEQWKSWSWQLQNRVESIDDLISLQKVDPTFQLDIEDVKKTQNQFNFSITPYYLSLMNLTDVNCPIRVQGLPSSRENLRLDNEYLDFPKEDSMMPVPGLTHRYPDRAMLYTTHHCAMYCRFCTRKRKVSDASSALRSQQILQAVEYLNKNKNIREVILSGGDIFSFSDDQLSKLLEKIRVIDHIEIIRLGTRNLVTLPFRVTDNLVEILGRYSPIYIHTHFNHPGECTNEALSACRKLREGGCVINNHTVILKGVNDNLDTLKELNQKLVLMGVQPYYMYHCDLTFGSAHFRTKISEDIALVQGLHKLNDWTRDISMPHYMIDTPGGGKVELLNL